MSAERLVVSGGLASGQAVVGDVVGLAVEAAGDRDGVGPFSHRHITRPWWRAAGSPGLWAAIAVRAALESADPLHQLGHNNLTAGERDATLRNPVIPVRYQFDETS